MMSKIITDTEISDILAAAIANFPKASWAASHLSVDVAYKAFLEDLGKLVARHFGGSFNRVSEPDGIEHLGHTLSFTWDRRVPDGGGIYACFDADVAIKAWKKDYPNISEFGKLI
jgi:hypothetical protein